MKPDVRPDTGYKKAEYPAGYSASRISGTTLIIIYLHETPGETGREEQEFGPEY